MSSDDGIAIEPAPPDPRTLARAWKNGQLRWLLYPYQDALYTSVWHAIQNPGVRQYCLNVSRQFGKTFTLVLIALEMCLRKPGAQVRFAAPTQIELFGRTLPIMRTILQTCPLPLRPRWNGQIKGWQFYNGSTLRVAGVNNGHADDLRGSACDLAVIDEGGFCDEFKYLLESVLLPQTLKTRGTLIGSSTPPRTLAHEYVPFATDCRTRGNYTTHTIFDTDMTADEIAVYADLCGGQESTTFQREYMAQFVVDSQLAIIPEWHARFERAHDDTPLRRFWHNYTAMDIGESKNDFTAVLFGHYNFLEARLYVEDELIDRKLPRMQTAELAREIRLRERKLWQKEADPTPPSVRMRVADNNAPNLLVALTVEGLPFMATSKDELYAMTNNLRVWCKTGRVVVNPRCSNLIDCLKLGIWADEAHIGREFDRNTSLGHLDALAALVYLARNVDTRTNPVPDDFGRSRTDNFFSPRGGGGAPAQRDLANAFGRPRRVTQ